MKDGEGATVNWRWGLFTVVVFASAVFWYTLLFPRGFEGYAIEQGWRRE